MARRADGRAKRTRTLRKSHKISEEAVALAAGLDRSYLDAIELGEKNVRPVNIHRIADALGVGAGVFGAEVV